MAPRALNIWIILAASYCTVAVESREPRALLPLTPLDVPLDAKSSLLCSSNVTSFLFVVIIVCAATVVGFLRQQPSSRGRPDAVRMVAFQEQFRLFEYICPNCNSKRLIQYFLRDGAFLPQEPRAVCGCCNVSALVKPFKTVDYSCPYCKKLQMARLPARAVHLNTYNVTKVHCACGYHGQVSVGQLVDVICKQCSTKKRKLSHTWAADDGEVNMYCKKCQSYRTCAASSVRRTRSERSDAIEYACKNCSHKWSAKLEELIGSEGMPCCPHCSWVGYPEVILKSVGKVC